MISAFLNIDHGDRSWIADAATGFAAFAASSRVGAIADGAAAAGVLGFGACMTEGWVAAGAGGVVVWANSGDASESVASTASDLRMVLNKSYTSAQ
jgi:hypothetical protein